MKQQYLFRPIFGLAMLLAGCLAPHVASADAYIGEIRWVAFNFPPVGWAMCDGQLMSITQNPALYSLLGTNYGGDGKTNFRLPDLRGRAPIHVGSGYALGSTGGEEQHVLTVPQLPQHVHTVNVSPKEATSSNPTGNVLGKTSDGTPAYGNSPSVSLSTSTFAVGDTQPHENMKPYITLNCIIAVNPVPPIFPTQN